MKKSELRQLIREEIQKLKESVQKLHFVASSDKDYKKMVKAIKGSGYYAEEYPRDGILEFEEDSDSIDYLEADLQKIVDKYNINGHFEVQ